MKINLHIAKLLIDVLNDRIITVNIKNVIKSDFYVDLYLTSVSYILHIFKKQYKAVKKRDNK